jgi:hypothetical protein
VGSRWLAHRLARWASWIGRAARPPCGASGVRGTPPGWLPPAQAQNVSREPSARSEATEAGPFFASEMRLGRRLRTARSSVCTTPCCCSPASIWASALPPTPSRCSSWSRCIMRSLISCALGSPGACGGRMCATSRRGATRCGCCGCGNMVSGFCLASCTCAARALKALRACFQSVLLGCSQRRRRSPIAQQHVCLHKMNFADSCLPLPLEL